MLCFRYLYAKYCFEQEQYLEAEQALLKDVQFRVRARDMTALLTRSDVFGKTSSEHRLAERTSH